MLFEQFYFCKVRKKICFLKNIWTKANKNKHFANFLKIDNQNNLLGKWQVVFFEKNFEKYKKIAKSLDMGGGGYHYNKNEQNWGGLQ